MFYSFLNVYVFKYVTLRIVCFEGGFAGCKLIGVFIWQICSCFTPFNRRVSHTEPAIKNNRDELKLSIVRLRIFLQVRLIL